MAAHAAGESGVVIDPRKLQPFSLSEEALHQLLPHRAPLRLVDAVDAYAPAPDAALRAHKRLLPDEPVFAGHFPNRPIWPGAYTIEGLAQCCALLGALLERGADPAPGAPEPTSLGVLVTVGVKLTRPVLPGQRLDYLVQRTHVIDPVHRFEVEATVDGRIVATGTLGCARVEGG